MVVVCVDVTGEELVRRVTETACLVTQMMKSDWSLAAPLYPITSQYFSILQRYIIDIGYPTRPRPLLSPPVGRLSVLPRPPCTLLASCLSCVAVMATRTTVEVQVALFVCVCVCVLRGVFLPRHGVCWVGLGFYHTWQPLNQPLLMTFDS